MYRSTLVLVAVAIFGSVAAFDFPEPDWEAEPVENCAGSPYTGPLGRTVPTLQKFEIDINDADDMQYNSVAEINFLIDDSQSEGDEPRNVFVLNADKTLKVKNVYVYDVDAETGKQKGTIGMTQGYPPRRICADKRKNLLIVTMRGELPNKSNLGLSIRYEAEIKTDGKALHRVPRTEIYKGDFSNGQATMITPCIVGREAPIELVISQHMGPQVSSPVLQFDRRDLGTEHIFKRSEPMTVDKLSFVSLPRKR